MKGRIIDNHPVPGPEHRNSARLEPGFKDRAIAGPLNRNGGDQLSPPITRHPVDASLTLAGFEGVDPLPGRGIAVAIIVPFIHSRRVDIDSIRGAWIADLALEVSAFGFIPLAVAVGLFFRVNPIFCKALDIVRWLMGVGQSAAISAWVLS